MKLKKLFITPFLLAFLLFMFNSCSFHKKTQTKTSVTDTSSSANTSIATQIENFKPQIVIHKIAKLDIPTFLTITLSQMEQQVTWLSELYKKAGASNTAVSETQEGDDSESKDFIDSKDQMKNKFFEQWGTTESDFAQFGINNSSKIQDYLTKHTEIQKQMDTLQQFLSKIQEGSPDTTNDYDNFNNEDAIIAKTPEN